ncbi:MAG TPA: phenylacetate--CoA ligase family protein [Ottowia sp.]|uniref:phenylacetate--CoA ligase family protein n=1 Tax=Ottowia sp. TaxID=1898956 RepID=UPI002BE2C88E|nr:AMP-binding protein [Ottowia sp.]HMN20714.1 phenylacetate--CoA ligase family protein [Ottowia sp.]
MSATQSPVFEALHLHGAMLDVVVATHAPRPLIRERQQRRLQMLLEAASASPLYRERIGGADPRTLPLAQIAPVTRAELMGRFDDWVTDPQLRLDDLLLFVRDAQRAADAWLGRYVVWESSGTSGQPGIFVQDARAMAVYDALEAVRHSAPSRHGRSLFGGFSPFDMLGAGDRHALVTATGGHFASVVSFERLRRLNPWLAQVSRTFSLLQPIDALVEGLNTFRPTVLATYPTAAAMLADEAEAGRLHIRPRCVLTGGETLSDAVRQRVGTVFDAPVRGSYGTSEFLPIAWECSHGRLHVNADWVFLEPVDEQHRPVLPGERSHSVLLTNLANWVQPLIRYDLGDRILVHPERCACGSALPTVDVHGRSDDVMRVPSERAGETVSLLPLSLCTVMEEECGVFDFQLRQHRPDTLVLRLPQTGAAAEATVDRCRTALQRFARMQGAQPVRVLGELGCEVPRGRSGKACRVALELAA